MTPKPFPPEGIDQERTTPVKEEATEEIELRGDTLGEGQRQSR